MSKDMKRRGQKEHSKRGDKQKQIYIHNKTCNDTIYQPLRSGRIWHKVSF